MKNRPSIVLDQNMILKPLLCSAQGILSETIFFSTHSNSCLSWKRKVFLRILHSLLLVWCFFVLLKVSEKALDIEAMFLPTSIYGFHCAFKGATSFHIQIKLLTVLKKKINSLLLFLPLNTSPWLMASLYQVELGPAVRFSSCSERKV